MDSARIAYLEMIQRTIDRMAGESAHMKQYCLVSIAAVLSAAAATDTDPLALAGLLFVAAFWFLDAQYLTQERWYRTLYDRARLDTEAPNFVMTPGSDIRDQHGLRHTLRGWSTAPLYSALGLLCLVVAV